MNPFLIATHKALNRNGLDLQYKSNTRVVNPITGTATTTVVVHTVRMYPRHLNATQFNYPTLVGKDTYTFYLSGDVPFKPNPSDTIEYEGKTYRVSSVQGHSARGQVCLYMLVGVAG